MKIVIAGAGEVGSHLARLLREEANDVTVLDDDEKRLSQLTSVADVEAQKGSPALLSVLRKARVDICDLFIAVYPSTFQEINIVSALLGKKLGAKKVMARINSEEFLSADNKVLFRDMGIELMFYPEKIAADEIASSIRHCGASDAMDFAHGKLQISVFKLEESSMALDLRLADLVKDVTEKEKVEFRVIALIRGEKTIIPKPDTKFLFGDTVYTISTKDGAAPLARYFGTRNMELHSVMIIGGGSIALMAARSLAKAGYDVKLIDSDRERCMELTQALPDSVDIVCGDTRNADFLLEEGIKQYDAFVALTSSDESNVLSCVMAKKFGVINTIAEVENIEYIHLAEDMGVDSVINRKLLTAGRIFKYTLSGKARFVKYMSGTAAQVIEYTAEEGSAITKGELKDLRFPQSAVIGGIIRGSESFIAVGSTRIMAGDRVAVFTLPENVKAIDKMFR